MFKHKPFQEGDIVVANGLRLNDGEHFFGTGDTMEEWEGEQTRLLVLTFYRGEGTSFVTVTDEEEEYGGTYDYHPLELSHAD